MWYKIKQKLKKIIPLLDFNRWHQKRAASYSIIKGKRCLVIGCNTGKECSYFLRLGASKVCGVDIIDDIGSEYNNPRIKYYKASAEDLRSLENNSYDLVYSNATMEHVSRIDLAFSEMARVTKPGGVIYCISGPLWNSRQGHHKQEFFLKYPWIHLRMNEDEIVNFSKAAHIQDRSTGQPIEEHIKYMLDPRFFNKVPAKRYVEICANLVNIEIILNKINLENEKYLSLEIFDELRLKGYEKEELLALQHIFVAKKL